MAAVELEDGSGVLSMAHYRKKPVVIEAVQFFGTGESCDEVLETFNPSRDPSVMTWKDCTYDGGHILTLEGRMEFSKGDYIIRGIKGELYPCKPDIFEATYKAV